MPDTQRLTFTEKAIGQLGLEPGRKDRIIFDAGCPGLGLRITSKSKVFLAQWPDPADPGKKVRYALGAFGSLSLREARDGVRVIRGKLARGIDPKAERTAARAAAEQAKADRALTLDALLTAWVVDLKTRQRRSGYIAEADRAVRSAFAKKLASSASALTIADVKAVLKPMAAKHATTAARTLAYGRAAYGRAIRDGKVKLNPFKDQPIEAVSNARTRLLTGSEVREIWTAAGGLKAPFGPAVRLLLLTLARRGEVAGMRWSEISADCLVWTQPGARTKNAQAHAVHLATSSRELLASLPRANGRDLIFPTRKGRKGWAPLSGWSVAKRGLDVAIAAGRASHADISGTTADAMPKWTFHDFRRAGVSYLASVGVDVLIADKLLNHVPVKLRGVSGVYQLHDFAKERAAALDAWAAHVTGEPATVDVVTLGRAG